MEFHQGLPMIHGRWCQTTLDGPGRGDFDEKAPIKQARIRTNPQSSIRERIHIFVINMSCKRLGLYRAQSPFLGFSVEYAPYRCGAIERKPGGMAAAKSLCIFCDPFTTDHGSVPVMRPCSIRHGDTLSTRGCYSILGNRLDTGRSL